MTPVLIAAFLAASACHRESPPTQGAATSHSRATTPEPRAAPTPVDRSPVVLELFTSQGCSSCPPADELLSVIGKGAGGGDVIAVAHHVDYWNYIGWRDPFSSAAASERQRRYGDAIAGGRVYTPMLVIDGRAHVVGSIAGQVALQLERARARAPSGWAVEIDDASMSGGRVTAEIAVSRPAGAAEVTLWAGVRESGLETEVTRGENAGETLTNDFIVRELSPLDSSRARQRIDLEAPRGGADEHSVVVIVQDRASLAVRAAAVADL